ncbi:MAG TPA: PAS domain-containing protein [Hyphomicrobiaceae bacterium]|nr:PAS domain-containing protein [Hyphomicrobiaceae bacterium]
MQTLQPPPSSPAAWPRKAWSPSLGAATVLSFLVGGAYLLAADLSLELLTKPDGVAAFWPAAGIASGTLIALGSWARLPTAIGVAAATLAANLLGDRNLAGAVIFAASNAGEAILIGHLISQQFGARFSLDSVQRVLAFFGVVGVATMLSGIGGTAGFALFHSPGAPLLTVWANWVASDALGSILVAPLLIGLGGLLLDLPDRWEVAKATLTLAALVIVSATAFTAGAEGWYNILPLALLLPVLVAAQCRPVFAAAAAIILGFGVIWVATFPIGEPTYSHDQVYAARATLLAISICTLILAALFAERRGNEAALKDANERLQLALDACELGVWSIDAKSGRFDSDDRDKRIHGHSLASPPINLAEVRPFVHPEDLPRLDEAFAASKRGGGSCKLEYRLAPALSGTEPGQDRWVAVEGTVVCDGTGEPIRWLGVTRDITHRKRAEQALAERDAQLALAGKVALAGGFTFDLVTGMMQVSQGYAAIHGLPEACVETSRSDWRRRVHPDDLPTLDRHLVEAVAAQRRDHRCEYRLARESGEIRWIESRSLITYDREGTAQRIIGTNIDVTARKQAEAALAESEARLADALAAGQVIAFEWNAVTGKSQRSTNAASILGPEPEASDGYNDFFARVHPDDRAGVKAQIRRLRRDRPGYGVCFRFCCRDGREVWLEETARGEFDSAGRLLRVKGLTRDISERKRVELALAERTLQLALAAKAALVGSFSYDVNTDTLQVSEGYAALHDLPDGTTEIRRADWQARMHLEDLGRVEEVRRRALRERRGEYETEYRIVRRDGEVRWIESRSFICYGGDGNPQRVVGVNIDVTERKQAEEHRNILNAELDHRVKNVLATVGAIIRHTQHSTPSMGDFVTALEQRIESLAGTHELLSHSNWRGVALTEVIEREFAPYAGDNAEIGGPNVTLKAEAAQAVAMVLHELTTNSAKYGAFSNEAGRVRLNWDWPQNGRREHLVVDWEEIGGPQIVAPPASGYGSSVIRELIPFELGGAVELAFAWDGVRCRLEIPAEWLSPGHPLSEEGQRSMAGPWQFLTASARIARSPKDFS